MNFYRSSAQIFIPTGHAPQLAFERITHLAIGAHPDDVELMAIDGILQCYRQPQKGFSAVILTNGAGSPRLGRYQDYSGEQMRQMRIEEQKKAAALGEYAALVMLDYPSLILQDFRDQNPTTDLVQILQAAHPSTLYIHNPADRHPTHVAAALRAIQAVRKLPAALRPEHLYGCEVWRDLDWLPEDERIIFDVSLHPELQADLLAVFESQIGGGKRYDLAALGRRRSHATFSASHAVDHSEGAAFALDLTALIHNPNMNIQEFVLEKIDRFAHQVSGALDRFLIESD